MTDHWKPSGGKFKKLLTLEPISFWYFRLKEKMQIWRHDMLYYRNSIIHKFYTTLTVNEKISHIEIKFAEDIKVTTKFDVL